MSNRIGTTYRRQHSHPRDQQRDAEEVARVEQLAQIAAVERDNDDRDLLGEVNEYLTEKTMAAGGIEPLTSEPFDQAILQANANAAERTRVATMTKDERLGEAVADALVKRGIVPEPPAPTVSDDLDGDDEEDEDETGFYSDEEGTVWYRGEDEEWERISEDEDDEGRDDAEA